MTFNTDWQTVWVCVCVTGWQTWHKAQKLLLLGRTDTCHRSGCCQCQQIMETDRQMRDGKQSSELTFRYKIIIELPPNGTVDVMTWAVICWQSAINPSENLKPWIVFHSLRLFQCQFNWNLYKSNVKDYVKSLCVIWRVLKSKRFSRASVKSVRRIKYIFHVWIF